MVETEIPVIQSTSSDEVTSDVDDLIERIGCGLSQFLLQIVMMLFNLTSGYQLYIMYFAGNSPPWTCTSNNSSEFCVQHFNQTFDARDKNFKKRCSMNHTEWKYTKDSKYSIVTEFDLACGKEYLAALANTAVFIGWAVGGAFTAVLADKYGRKKPLVVCTFCVGALAIGSTYVTAIWQLIIVRVFIGACTGTLCPLGYIYLSELTSIKYRSLCMNLFNLSGSIYSIMMGVFAMHVQEWRKLQFYAALPTLAIFFIMLVVPESPRWLHATGKMEKAERILQRIIRLNGTAVDSFTLTSSSDTTLTKGRQKHYSYIDLFKGKSITLFVLAVAFMWFSCGLVYYGFLLEASHLGGSIYVNYILCDLAGFAAALAAIYLLTKSRQKNFASAFFFCGFISVALASLPTSWKHGSVVRIVLAVTGKFLISLSFSTSYLWSVELFPIIIRSQGMTICQVASRIGSASAPFITNVLRGWFVPLPFIIMSSVCILAAITSLFLPETKGKQAHESFDDLKSALARHKTKKFSMNDDLEPLYTE